MAHEPVSPEINKLCGALNLHDLNQSITKEQLADISQVLRLSSDELDIIFDALDHDNKGHITLEDLRFEIADNKSSTPTKRRISQGHTNWTDNRAYINLSPEDLDVGVFSETSQEQVIELYQTLHASENPELLTQFENIILGVIKDIRVYQQENDRLEKTFKREKEQHERHLRSLEDEMDVHTQKVEERVKKAEMERSDQEKAEMKQLMDAEIAMLQQNLKRMQSEGIDRVGRETEEYMCSLKTRVEEYQLENRQLRSELTDTQTNLALVKGELVSTKQQFHEKSRELEVERTTVMDCIREQDNLTRQLHILHETNQKLLDANDNLRESLETSQNKLTCHKRTLSNDSAASGRSTSPRPPRKGSVMSDYFETAGPQYHRTASVNSSLAEEICESELNMMQVSSVSPLRRLRHLESCEDDEMVVGFSDSGHSTMRDYNEPDTESECLSYESDARSLPRRPKRLKPGNMLEEEEFDSHDEMETDAETAMERSEAELFRTMQSKRLSSSGSRGSRGSLRSLPTNDTGNNRSPKGNRGSTRRHMLTSPEQVLSVKVSKEPERMYKVVLAGDAAVGKSSFIMRLCKGKFVNNLSSTLGVDFQTKVIEVDGRTIALQLWDTAGQERFRSIAKSYFRRADGVLLLYDCTYERSFLNVRDWVEAVEVCRQDGAMKKIPIMFCANKTDIRDEMQQQGRRVVRFEDGSRLSREYEGLFIETSAKDGSNIQEAVIELTRLLRTNEDIEVKNVGMQLQDMKMVKKSTSCCSR
ncbi:ras and EF-hand domain-containing protein homolog isoform X3 [Haliotis rufescens]|uniref:ras and EF-hand domain-containing protein homolog isoform X3 n=1 Tax=Haliotis rufescens TaxID=6454 RepID=UPI00201FAFF6|nr:ras and EF-hand domain-containing protein homolog isoform X3 [Haliotis rufescens]